MAKIPEKELKKHINVLILCGGGGTRLWPRSRNRFPKQFAKLINKESLFQMTVRRFAKFLPYRRIFVVTTKGYEDIIRRQTPELPKENIIIEPARKNTTMAHGFAALYIKRVDPEAIIITDAADHPIEKVEKYWKNYLVSAATAATGDVLVTTGIVPEYPHTGLGYVKAGKLFKKFDGISVYKVDAFKEKPDLKTAKKFHQAGNYFWHANLFVWKATSILKAIKKHHSPSYQVLKKIDKVMGTSGEERKIARLYQEAPVIAIEYSVAEKAKNFYVVRAQFDWQDIGSWNVIYDISKKDKNKNAIIKHGENGGVIALESKNNLVQIGDQLLALIGVNGLAIVDTKDALLVCRLDKAEKVKQVVKKLRKQGKVEYL